MEMKNEDKHIPELDDIDECIRYNSYDSIMENEE